MVIRTKVKRWEAPVGLSGMSEAACQCQWELLTKLVSIRTRVWNHSCQVHSSLGLGPLGPKARLEHHWGTPGARLEHRWITTALPRPPFQAPIDTEGRPLRRTYEYPGRHPPVTT